MLTIVFDPADLIVRAKVPLFCLVWLFAILIVFFDLDSHEVSLPLGLTLYAFTFALLLPLLSLTSFYLFQSGSVEVFEGVQVAKAFLFSSLCIPLSLVRARVMAPMAYVLTALACTAIVLTIMVTDNTALSYQLWSMFVKYKNVSYTNRTYGPLSYESAYFPTAPLLIISIAYFTEQARRSSGFARKKFICLAALNAIGMIVEGTRNCILAGLLTPALVVWWHGNRRQKTAIAISALALTSVVLIFARTVVAEMFSLEEHGNLIRMIDFRDYMRIFSDPWVLMFGQGIGTYFNTSAYGRTYFTELMYLNAIREWGLVGAIPLFLIMLYPLTALRDHRVKERHYIFLAYLVYLGTCISDPFLFASGGMCVFAIVVYHFYVVESRAIDVIPLRSTVSAAS